jgi:periplasmic protein TonB
MERSGLRRHLSGSVPISIALHLVALLLFLIIPLTATMILPDPAAHLPDYMRATPIPPPPPPAVRPRITTAPAPTRPPDSDRAPIAAPDTIHPETDQPVRVPDVGTVAQYGEVLGGAGQLPVAPVVLPPPDPPRPSGPVRVADLPVTPRKVGDLRPVYPEIARSARVEGTVIMEAVLDTSGRVTQLRVIQSSPMLDQAALDAVRQWRYTPSLYGGHPVSVLMTITVRFTLK